jgi:hypothetical protein
MHDKLAYARALKRALLIVRAPLSSLIDLADFRWRNRTSSPPAEAITTRFSNGISTQIVAI